MPNSDKISKAKLSNKFISEESIVTFIADCLRETGGIPSISTKLSHIGFNDFSKEAYKILDVAAKTGWLDLTPYSSEQIRDICSCVVNELESCEDLDTLMNLTLESANDLLKKI